MSSSALDRRALLERSVAGAASLLGLAPACLSSAAQAYLPPAPTVDVTPAEADAMRQLARNFMNRYSVPAFSFSVGHNGAQIYVDALGWAIRPQGNQAGQAVTSNNLFRIASISKTITSVTIFSLIAQGGLHLSDKVFGLGAILGTAYGSPPYRQYVDQITVEQLLTHTCGGWSNDRNDPMFKFPQKSQAELITWVLQNVPLTNAPGTHYAYSNFGYCVLGRVIEKITRQAYADYVRNSVLRRCGVLDMVIAGNTLAQRLPNEVEYYAQNGENPYAMNVTRMDSHGGWLASPADIVEFFMHIGGIIPGSNFLSDNLINAMTTPSDPSIQQGSPYAKGWSVKDALAPGQVWHPRVPHNWWHTGSLPGTTTVAVRSSGKFCWAGFTNTSRNGLQDHPPIGDALDSLMWDMVRSVAAWRDHV